MDYQIQRGPDRRTILVLDRPMVESVRCDEVLEMLLALTEEAATVRSAAGTIELIFSGYDDDPRELYVIPQVRSYVAKLDAVFPYWLHFLSKVDASLFVVMACLLPIETTTRDGGEVSAHFPSGSLSVLLFKLFTAMNGLYAAHGLTADETSQMTRLVKSYVDTYLP